jgi:AraC-like DNA-binding protein
MLDFDLWFVWAGQGQMVLNGVAIELRPGSTFCIRPGSAVRATHDPSRPLGVCYLHFDLLDSRGRPFQGRARHRSVTLPPAHATLDELELTERILRRAVRLAGSDDGAARAEATALAVSVLHAMDHAARQPGGRPRVQVREMHEIASLVRERPGGHWTVDELARRAGYSVDHFARLFRSVHGVSPSEFCIAARIERARHLLRDTALPIGTIAAALGYSDVYFFSRQFRQRVGQPPSQFRHG